MNYKSAWIGLFIGISGSTFGQSLNGSFTWSSNGHVYESWTETNGISYQDAMAFAATRGGTLATITSAAEQDAIMTNLGSVLPSTSYLGARQDPAETGVADNWAWVTGETWSYTNWRAGEPNDFNGPATEQNLEIYSNGFWNDIGDNDAGFNNGFLIEVVPEPSTMVVFAIGGLLAFGRRRK